MKKIFGAEKPSLLELAHSGVKGMRWGVRKAESTGSEIRGARARQLNRANQIHLQDKAIKEVRGKARTAAIAEKKRLEKDFATNEDRVVAARITKGEKFAHALLLGPLALVTVGSAQRHANQVQIDVDKARAKS